MDVDAPVAVGLARPYSTLTHPPKTTHQPPIRQNWDKKGDFDATYDAKWAKDWKEDGKVRWLMRCLACGMAGRVCTYMPPDSHARHSTLENNPTGKEGDQEARQLLRLRLGQGRQGQFLNVLPAAAAAVDPNPPRVSTTYIHN